MVFIAAHFPFLELLPIFWSVQVLKIELKNVKNSHIFAGEQNILNPKISSYTKTNLKIK